MQKRNVLYLFVAIMLFSCAEPNLLYKTENLSENGLSMYKTYAFKPTTDTAFTVMFDKKRLEKMMSTAAIKQLSKKGMSLDTVNPDCLFTYKLAVNRNYAVNQEQEMVYNPDVFVPAFDNQARIYTFSSDNKPIVYNGKIHIDTLREGTLVIDMIDRKKGTVVWRSSFEGKNRETYMQPNEGTVDEIIANMFKKFPRK